MPLSSGLAAQFGFTIETTVGVPVAPTVYLPLLSETLDRKKGRIESDAIIAGNLLMTSEQWNGGNVEVAGDINLEVYRRNLGKIMKLLFGNVVTTGAGPYTHTFTPADLSGQSATIQIGRPATPGVVWPYTYTGCKIASAQLACSVGSLLTLSLSVVGINEILYRTVTDGVTTNASPNISSATAVFTPDDDLKPISSGTAAIPAGTYFRYVTATTGTLSSVIGTPVNATATTAANTFTIGMPLGAASYTAGLGVPFKFTHGTTTTLGGAALRIKSATLDFDNGLATDRRFLGQPNISEAIQKDLRVYGGSIEVEFTDNTQYLRYINGGEASLVLGFAAGTDSFTITENVRLDGDTPNVAGKDLLSQTIPFKAIASGAMSTACTAVLVNGDSVA